MLTVEEIKKIFDNFEVEGFELDLEGIKVNELGITCTSSTNPTCRELFLFDIRTNKHLSANRFIYDLFLQRVIEGVNRKADELDLSIVTNKHYIEVVNWEYDVLEYFNYSDQAKEQAVKYIIENL